MASELRNRRVIILLGVSLCLTLFCFTTARACTIWAATGERVKDGGTVVAKNRDNSGHLYTKLKTVFPENGIPFCGIFDIEADGYVTAGINMKGLVVVNTSPNSVPKKKRHVATEDLTERLLVSFDSVKAVLSDTGLFQKSHPAIYIVADESKIASVEVAPMGRVAVSVKERGTLAFTNHYVDGKLTRANERLSRGSTMRLRRINQLLDRHGEPFTLDTFVVFSEDRNDGSEDGALWRDGSASSKIRTLASWIVRLPADGPASLYVKLANQNEPVTTQKLKLDDAFWEQKKNESPDKRPPIE